jgi:hypothetical protein
MTGRYEAEVPPLEQADEDPRDAEIARLRQEGIERDKQIAAQNARHDQMERDVERRFAANRQNAPAIDDMYAAQQELNIKDEELLDPQTAPAVIRRIAEHQAQKIAAEQDSRYGSVIGNVAGDVFELKLDRMKGREFFEDLEPLMREYFEDNPNELHVHGKVEEVYERLVGKNYEVLKSRRPTNDDPDMDPSEDSHLTDVGQAKTRYRQQSRVVDAPVQTSSPSGRAGEKGKKPVVLDQAREENRRLFEGLGVPMTPEEYVDIESGKKYPKQYAADIQVGLSKPNVDYE